MLKALLGLLTLAARLQMHVRPPNLLGPRLYLPACSPPTLTPGYTINDFVRVYTTRCCGLLLRCCLSFETQGCASCVGVEQG